MKKLRITKEQYSRIFENKLINESVLNEKDTFGLDKVVNDLIKYIYNDLPKFLKDKGLTDDEVIKKLKEDEIIIEKNGKFSISKSFKTKDNAKKALETAIKEMTNMSDEDEQLSEIDLSPWGYEQGSPVNVPDSTEPPMEEPIKGKKIGNFKLLAYHHDIAILSDDENNKFFFVFGHLVDNFNNSFDNNSFDDNIEDLYPKKNPLKTAKLGGSYFGKDNEIVEKAEQVAKLKGIGYGIEDFKAEIYDLVQLDKESIDAIKERYGLNSEILNALESNLNEAGVNWSDTYNKDLSRSNTDKKIGNEENQGILNSLKYTNLKAAEIAKRKEIERQEMLKKHLVKPEEELEEVTATVGSGIGFTGSNFFKPIKRQMENVYETAGGVPTYDAPAFQMKKNHTDFVNTKTDAKKETIYDGGTMVSFDGCTKLNNKPAGSGCSTGAVDGVVKYRKTKNSLISSSVNESKIFEEIAKKTGRTIEEVQLIIKKRNS